MDRSGLVPGLRFVTGDLFASRCQTLTNAVNCVGVMGAGIAREFRRRFPDHYSRYWSLCRTGQLRLGQPVVLPRATAPWVLLFPTKGDWRQPSRLADIEAGLARLPELLVECGVRSLALPALGCGRGGLAWSSVRPLIERDLGHLSIPVEVYEPR